MLTIQQVPHTVAEGQVLPGWLTPRDHPWLRVLVEELEAMVGQAMEVVDEELGDRIARRLARPTPGLAAARQTLLGAYTTEIDAPAAPAALRRAVFEAVARRPRREREDALAEMAASIGVAADALRATLFADRPGARRLVPLSAPIDPQALAERTNLAMAQALLARSEVVSISAGEHLRSIYRMAKLRRLICAAQVGAGGSPVVHVSGPLTLFHHSTKYGGALASFVPALVSTPAWSLEARCVLEGRRLLFRADASLPLARTHALPRAHDSDVERRLDRDLRKLARGWTLTREADVVRVADRLFFPDFTLVRGENRVLLEVVGFYTREYLRKKLEALRSVELPIIVLVDRKLACDDGEITADAVLRYEKKPDAAAVVAVAERLARAKPAAPEVSP